MGFHYYQGQDCFVTGFHTQQNTIGSYFNVSRRKHWQIIDKEKKFCSIYNIFRISGILKTQNKRVWWSLWQTACLLRTAFPMKLLIYSTLVSHIVVRILPLLECPITELLSFLLIEQLFLKHFSIFNSSNKKGVWGLKKKQKKQPYKIRAERIQRGRTWKKFQWGHCKHKSNIKAQYREDNKADIETILHVKFWLQRDGTAHRSQFKI